MEKMDNMRGTGRSTRLADKAIQDLFVNGFCIVQDHHREGRDASRVLMDKVLARLKAEHKVNMEDLNIHILNEYFRITLVKNNNEAV